jgi:hypothetical protein
MEDGGWDGKSNRTRRDKEKAVRDIAAWTIKNWKVCKYTILGIVLN